MDCRLTFWLSNTIVLRTIISDTSAEEELPVSAGPGPRKQKVERETEKRSSLKWKDSPLSKKDIESFGAWDDPVTFITALEKVEAWIFSRVVESIWWQVMLLCSPCFIFSFSEPIIIHMFFSFGCRL